MSDLAIKPKNVKHHKSDETHSDSKQRANKITKNVGIPRYLKNVKPDILPSKEAVENRKAKHNEMLQQNSIDACESEADKMADAVVNRNSGQAAEIETSDFSSVQPTSVQYKLEGKKSKATSSLGSHVGVAAKRNKGSGQALSDSTRQVMESGFHKDFSQVRIHTDSTANQLTQSAGANAFTLGSDIFFNQGKFNPQTHEGEHLLAHELTHVVQQNSVADAEPQFDLMQSLPTALGGFEIDMVTKAAPDTPGMQGHIRFLPEPTGPYSAQIGLIQTVNFTDVGGQTGAPGSPVDWTNVLAAAGVGAEAGRMELMTTGANAAPEGWMVDANTAGQERTAEVGPNYIEHWVSSAPSNQFGWLRSPTDIQQTSLYDYPRTPFDWDFDFETVAKATDTQAIYGALEWGFGIRSGVVQNEYVQAFDTESATFNEALERFRGYYTHEPIVLYFETGIGVPIAGEEAKIAGVLDYLNRYPDVQIRIDGHADERGSRGLNEDLAEQRALSVQGIATSMGIDASRIEWAVGWGETTEFSPRGGANEGSWRANRRVVMSFARTASTPIVMP